MRSSRQHAGLCKCSCCVPADSADSEDVSRRFFAADCSAQSAGLGSLRTNTCMHLPCEAAQRAARRVGSSGPITFSNSKYSGLISGWQTWKCCKGDQH